MVNEIEENKGPSLTVLIVDDDPTNRLVLKALLRRLGYGWAMATNGKDAVDVFKRERPDMILMDVMMPVMDGYEATRHIKDISGEAFVPIIFLTALNDDPSLAKCVESGGDDFLTKPYSHVILKAKLEALKRICVLYATVKAQKDELAYHQIRIEREQEIAQRLFSNIIDRGCLGATYIKHMLAPMGRFNGDLLLAAPKPSGGAYILLGDFTGHGLSAAVGAVPVSDVFYGMTANGFCISEIVTEINRKLRNVLPTSLFFATCIIELNSDLRTLTVWNGGIPEVLVCDKFGNVKKRLISHHLALGIVENSQFDNRVEMCEIDADDRIYLYSDGVIESINEQGDMYGEERLEACLPNEQGQSCFAHIVEDLAHFRGDVAQTDDITLIEISAELIGTSSGCERPDKENHRPKAPMVWCIALELCAESLKLVDALPLLMQSIMGIQGLMQHREHLYTVFAELFSNALDHGVLGLDSAIKETPNGFSEYYMLREERLDNITDGCVKIEIRHTQRSDIGGSLQLTIEDSGKGFDHTKLPLSLAENTTLSGRGIPLTRSLCSTLAFNDSGNQVIAVYDWEFKPEQQPE